MNSITNIYIADELAHKVKVLSKALHETQKIISSLEQENENLKDILMGLMSINKEDPKSAKEVEDDRFCTV